MMLRYILAVCFILHIKIFAAEENTYILFACDKDPKENGICSPVTSREYDNVTGFNELLALRDSLNSTNVTVAPTLSYYKINIWAMVPFSEDECYPFSKSLVEPALHQAVIDANETLCSDMSFQTLAEKVKAISGGTSCAYH